MEDAFESFGDSVSSPGNYSLTVTPSDTDPLPGGIPKVLVVLSGGTVVLRSKNLPTGAPDEVWSDLPPGFIIPVRAVKVLATGTDATAIRAVY